MNWCSILFFNPCKILHQFISTNFEHLLTYLTAKAIKTFYVSSSPTPIAKTSLLRLCHDEQKRDEYEHLLNAKSHFQNTVKQILCHVKFGDLPFFFMFKNIQRNCRIYIFAVGLKIHFRPMAEQAFSLSWMSRIKFAWFLPRREKRHEY